MTEISPTISRRLKLVDRRQIEARDHAGADDAIFSLSSIYQLQRLDIVGDISVNGTRCQSLKTLAETQRSRARFRDEFTPYPDYRSADAKKQYPTSTRKFSRSFRAECVIVATPDQITTTRIKRRSTANQHVLTVKPFVLT